MSKVEIYLSIVGQDFDPALINDQLQLHATYSFKKGDCLQYNKNANFSKWCLSSGQIEEDKPNFYEISKLLLSVFSNKVNQIIELKNLYDLEVTLQGVITLSNVEDYPIIGFDKEVIEFLSKIEASIDIDVIVAS